MKVYDCFMYFDEDDVLSVRLEELNKYVDYDTQFNKSFLEPLKIILDAIQWKVERRNTLEQFFV